MTKKEIPHNVLSDYGNAKAMATDGISSEIKDRNQKKVDQLESEYPGIAAALSSWSRTISKFLSEL